MKLPKATLRKSGFRMMNTSVEFVVGIDTIISGIAHGISRAYSISGYIDDPDATLSKITRASAFAATRQMLKTAGSEWYADTSETVGNVDLDDGDMRKIAECAKKLFPELSEDLTNMVKKK